MFKTNNKRLNWQTVYHGYNIKENTGAIVAGHDANQNGLLDNELASEGHGRLGKIELLKWQGVMIGDMMEYKCPNCKTEFRYKYYEVITAKGSFCPNCAGGIIDAKSADLVNFGRHLPTCRKSRESSPDNFECTCGFDAAKNK